MAMRHEYFDMLGARSDLLRAYSLRDPAQLRQFAQSQTRALAVTYDPANDPDARRQDAAKAVTPANRVSLPNQVRLPIPSISGTKSLFVTWDAWFGQEFRF